MVVWYDPDDETVIYWSHNGIKCKPEDVHKADLDALILAYEVIQNGQAPEVIRCKDCKHYGGDWWMGDCHLDRWGDGWGNYPRPRVTEDGYCAWGERREDDRDQLENR